MTSHDVVARVRRLTKVKRSGHGGTLDPMAEGVLPMALGQACRLIDYLPSDKTYVGEVLLGRRTSTDDVEGDVIEEKDASHITREQIEEALPQFRGEIKQHPPVVSAIRIGGQHLYDLARKGMAPEKAPERQVCVHQLDLLSVDIPKLTIRVRCSKGTYIRSIARDLGDSLGVGGCLSKLVREKAGNLSIEDAYTLEALKEHIDKNDWQSIFVDLGDALNFAKVEVIESDAQRIFNGRTIEIPTDDLQLLLQRGALQAQKNRHDKENDKEDGLFVLALQNGVYVALLKQVDAMTFKPEVVFSDARVSP